MTINQFLINQLYILLLTMDKSAEQVEKKLRELIYVPNQKLDSAPIKGYDFNKGVDYSAILSSYSTTGLQASNFAQGVRIINRMISWRLSDDPLTEYDDEQTSKEEYRAKTRARIFLGYTSNMVSSGIRETIRYLVQHKMVDCVVTSAGGIQEDIMKCMGDFKLGAFNMDDKQNRLNGHCRIGNILVTNQNYIKLEGFLLPLFAQLYKIQKKTGQFWTPSKIIAKLGQKINHEESIYYWAWKNNIPVFCPGFTDGALGDILFTNSYKNDLVVDVVQDIKAINRLAMTAPKSGVIILGGSIPKHHILNANIWRNGADFGVFINTGLFEDGSDSGAKIQEAYTWGKVRLTADFTKIFCEASLIFPLLVAETFAKREKQATKL